MSQNANKWLHFTYCFAGFVDIVSKCGNRNIIKKRKDTLRKMHVFSSQPTIISRAANKYGECGAQVKSTNIISRSVLISWYISALPQYLERYAARYTNPLRIQWFLQICTCKYSASGFGFAQSTKKRKTPTLECLFLVTNTGISLVLQGLHRRRRGCGSIPSTVALRARCWVWWAYGPTTTRKRKSTTIVVLSCGWWPVRESNPCYSRERAVS